MKKDADINFLVRLVLRVITFLQVACLKQDNNEFYYKLTKLHFKLYFGKNLVNESLYGTPEFRAAQERHTSMVMIHKFKVNKGKNSIAKAVKHAFQNNLLLEVEL